MGYMKNAISSGACLTCLDSGTESYPLDYAYHMATSGHWPALSETLYADVATWHEANGQPLPAPREQQQLSLREKITRRVRVHRIAAATFACGAAGILAGYCAGLCPWWAALGSIPFAVLALSNITAAGRLILITRDPLFYLLAIRHDLGL